jgi:CheY-like chemotaxis protein
MAKQPKSGPSLGGPLFDSLKTVHLTSLSLPIRLGRRKWSNRKLNPERKRDKMNRILLADSNPTLRSALALLLETRLNAQVVGQVSSMEGLLCEAAATHPDVIIVGLELPGEPAQGRMLALREKAPRASILLASVCPESVNLTEGTDAFLCETDPPETILNTIQKLVLRNVCEGEQHV